MIVSRVFPLALNTTGLLNGKPSILCNAIFSGLLFKRERELSLANLTGGLQNKMKLSSSIRKASKSWSHSMQLNTNGQFTLLKLAYSF
jgi:hypothetical protein